MGNTTTLLLLSFALLVSCGKETDRYVTDVDNDANVIATYMCDSSLPFADPILKERYLIIEDSIRLYVGELERIEELYYTQNVSSEELVQLSIAGLELQEELRSYIKSIINDNIENVLGIYMLAVYGELFTSNELHSLIKRIPPYPAYTSNNPFYEIIMQTTKGIGK